MSPPLSMTRQFSEELLEYACLADETASLPLVRTVLLPAATQRAVARLARLNRALVRQSVVVQLALRPYLPREMGEAA